MQVDAGLQKVVRSSWDLQPKGMQHAERKDSEGQQAADMVGFWGLTGRVTTM